MDQDPTAAQAEDVIRTIAMAADALPSGDIFGHWPMGQRDLASGNAAARRARGRRSTAAADGLALRRPVVAGDACRPRPGSRCGPEARGRLTPPAGGGVGAALRRGHAWIRGKGEMSIAFILPHRRHDFPSFP